MFVYTDKSWSSAFHLSLFGHAVWNATFYRDYLTNLKKQNRIFVFHVIIKRKYSVLRTISLLVLCNRYNNCYHGIWLATSLMSPETLQEDVFSCVHKNCIIFWCNKNWCIAFWPHILTSDLTLYFILTSHCIIFWPHIELYSDLILYHILTSHCIIFWSHIVLYLNLVLFYILTWCCIVCWPHFVLYSEITLYYILT